MSFLADIIERIRPAEIVLPSGGGDEMKGSGTAEALTFKFFRQIQDVLKNMSRSEFLAQVLDMSNDFAIADKALERICSDATKNAVTIDAPSRRKKLIADFLRTIKYEDNRKSWLKLTLRDGDSFFQKEYTKSVNPKRLAFISRIMRMPTETMIRNTNERDEFTDENNAFYQVPDIKAWPLSLERISFPLAKIHHARNDWEESLYFRYGRSIWASCVRVFNMAVMGLEDSAVQRHQSTQNITYHFINRKSDTRASETFIKEYARRFRQQWSENTTHLFLDGKNEVEQLGGTKNIIGTIEDLRLILSILSLALDYPLDLLSVGLTGDSGGEELFRKEVVLKRTIESVIDRENKLILRPLIDAELLLAGDKGTYRITTFPTSFEDANKKSKRGIMEFQAGLKSFRSYHDENNPEISSEDERKRIEEDVDWKKRMGIGDRVVTQSDPASGESGSRIEPDNQQERLTPGQTGTEER